MFNGTTIRFGWDSPLTVEEEEEEEEGEVEVEQDFFPRYSNPWSQTEWGSKVIRWSNCIFFDNPTHKRIEAGGNIMELDLDSIAVKSIENHS